MPFHWIGTAVTDQVVADVSNLWVGGENLTILTGQLVGTWATVYSSKGGSTVRRQTGAVHCAHCAVRCTVWLCTVRSHRCNSIAAAGLLLLLHALLFNCHTYQIIWDLRFGIWEKLWFMDSRGLSKGCLLMPLLCHTYHQMMKAGDDGVWQCNIDLRNLRVNNNSTPKGFITWQIMESPILGRHLIYI